MPFAGYRDFDDCVAKNRDKEDPKGYCATIQRRVERGMREGASPDLSPGDAAALAIELKIADDPMLRR